MRYSWWQPWLMTAMAYVCIWLYYGTLKFDFPTIWKGFLVALVLQAIFSAVVWVSKQILMLWRTYQEKKRIVKFVETFLSPMKLQEFVDHELENRAVLINLANEEGNRLTKKSVYDFFPEGLKLDDKTWDEERRKLYKRINEDVKARTKAFNDLYDLAAHMPSYLRVHMRDKSYFEYLPKKTQSTDSQFVPQR